MLTLRCGDDASVIDGGADAPTTDSTVGDAGAVDAMYDASDAAPRRVSVNAVFPPDSTNPLFAAFNQHILTAADVDGVNPVLTWASVDHGPDAGGGQYQWPAAFDTQFASYVSAGKRVNIIVEPISEPGGPKNLATPGYVVGAVDTVTCSAYAGFPVVWETAFKDNYKNFIAAVIARYASNPNVGYMRFGLTVGGEIYPFCASALAAYLPDGGGVQAAILDYDAEMLAFEKQQSPTFYVVGPTTYAGTDATYVNAEAANAVAQGFGFGSQGLQASDLTTYPVTATNWGKLFNQYAGQAPILELQTFGQSDPSGTCATSDGGCINGAQQATGPLPPLLALALAHNVTTFEIYTKDLLVAYDPANPDYATYHTAYAGALAAVHLPH